MHGIDHFVCVRRFLLYDHQNPGFSSRIDAMQCGIERHGVRGFADRHGGDHAVLIQVEDCQRSIPAAADEQPAMDLINGHPGWRLATLQRPTLYDGTLCDVDGYYRAG